MNGIWSGAGKAGLAPPMAAAVEFQLFAEQKTPPFGAAHQCTRNRVLQEGTFVGFRTLAKPPWT